MRFPARRRVAQIQHPGFLLVERACPIGPAKEIELVPDDPRTASTAQFGQRLLLAPGVAGRVVFVHVTRAGRAVVFAIRAEMIAPAEIPLEPTDEPERMPIRIRHHRRVRDVGRHVVLAGPLVRLGIVRIDAFLRIKRVVVSAQLIHLAVVNQALRSSRISGLVAADFH